MNIRLNSFYGCIFFGVLSTSLASGAVEESAKALGGLARIKLEDKITELKENYSTGKYQEAADLSKKLLILDSANEGIRDYYTLANYKLKNYKAITELYSERQAGYLDSPLQLKLRSVALSRENNFVSAIASLRTLKNLAPLSPEWKAFYHYLVFKINSDSSFRELERMNKSSPNIANDLTAGKLYLLLGMHDKAIAAFEAGLRKNYINEEALEYLGDCYLKKKKLEQSIFFYSTLLNIRPENAKVRVKLAKGYVKNGQLIKGAEVLGVDNNSEVVELREKLAIAVSDFFNGTVSRSIAEEKIQLSDISVSENKSPSEEGFIPKDLDTYAGPTSKDAIKENSVALSVSPDTKTSIVNDFNAGDVSIVELSVGAKAKKYDLSGVGFNARADYATGGSINVKYTFFPIGRSWNSQIMADYSRVKIGEFRGLSPAKTTLSEFRIATGVNYLASNFSVGPVFMYEKMSATQTAPSSVRGNVDFLNIGLKSAYSIQAANNLKLNLEASYHRRILSVSKTISVGQVEGRSLAEASVKLYYEMRPSAYYFVGLGFLQTSTQYSASSDRGTSQAVEKEKEFTFPIGINYAF